MKYLIACDLDGSLLNKQGELTEKSITVLNQLRNQGHIVVLATGRPFGGAISKYKEIGLDTVLITDNGGSIENPMDTTFAKQKTYIPLEVMHQLFTFSKPFIVSAFFSTEQVVYAYKYDPRLEEFFSGVNSNIVVEKEFTDLSIEPTGIVFLIERDAMKTFENYIDEQLGNTLSHRLWGVDNRFGIYEVYLKHVSKSSALHYLLDYYDIPKKRWISFGDGINDVEMIRDSGHGVAMKNAVPEVLKVSKDITKFTHDEDGIPNYLIHYFNLDDLK